MQLQASYPDGRHWEELLEMIDKNCGLKEPCTLAAITKCNLTKDEFDEEYIGLYAPGQLINDPCFGPISFNSSISIAFKLKVGYNLKLFLVGIKVVTGKDIAEHLMRPAKLIPTSFVAVTYAHC
jgi:hypothetical protein